MKLNLKTKWISRILFLAVIVTVVYYITHNFSQFVKFDFIFNWKHLVLSFLLTITSYIAMFFVWQNIAFSFKLNTHWIKAAKYFFYSQLGKYLPGNIGLLVVRLDAYKDYPRRKVIFGTTIEYIVAFEAMCITSLLGLLFAPVEISVYIRWFSLGGVIIFFVMLWPPFLKKSVNLTFRILKREPINDVPSFFNMLCFVFGNLVVTFLFGLAFYFVLCSFTPINSSYYLPVTGAFYSANIVGVIAFFSPSGIGIREGILFLILPTFIPKPAVIVGAILIRLIATGSELFLALVSYIIFKLKNSSN